MCRGERRSPIVPTPRSRGPGMTVAGRALLAPTSGPVRSFPLDMGSIAQFRWTAKRQRRKDTKSSLRLRAFAVNLTSRGASPLDMGSIARFSMNPAGPAPPPVGRPHGVAPTASPRESIVPRRCSAGHGVHRSFLRVAGRRTEAGLRREGGASAAGGSQPWRSHSTRAVASISSASFFRRCSISRSSAACSSFSLVTMSIRRVRTLPCQSARSSWTRWRSSVA